MSAPVVGDRFQVSSSIINAREKVPFAAKYQGQLHKMKATVTFIRDGQISFMLEGVPGYYGPIVRMELARFGMWFEPKRDEMNLAKAYQWNKHSEKVFPDYFLK